MQQLVNYKIVIDESKVPEDFQDEVRIVVRISQNFHLDEKEKKIQREVNKLMSNMNIEDSKKLQQCQAMT